MVRGSRRPRTPLPIDRCRAGIPRHADLHASTAPRMRVLRFRLGVEARHQGARQQDREEEPRNQADPRHAQRPPSLALPPLTGVLTADVRGMELRGAGIAGRALQLVPEAVDSSFEDGAAIRRDHTTTSTSRRDIPAVRQASLGARATCRRAGNAAVVTADREAAHRGRRTVPQPACGSARGGAGASRTVNGAGRVTHQTAAAGSARAQPRSRPTWGSKP